MRRIRNSAKALIIKDGKMAAIKIRDAGEEWYIMPGGGQEAEETLNEAVCREVSEELGIAIECKAFCSGRCSWRNLSSCRFDFFL